MNIIKPTRNALFNFIKKYMKKSNFDKLESNSNSNLNIYSNFSISNYSDEINMSILNTLNVDILEKTNKCILDPNIYPKIVSYYYKLNENNYNKKEILDNNQVDLDSYKTNNISLAGCFRI